MTTLESVLLSYVANALWQIPLLFAAGWLTTRILRGVGPAAEHRAWACVLLLQAFLPAGSTISWASLRTFLNFSGPPLNNGQPHVSIVMGPGTAFINPHFPAWLLALLAIAYVVITACFVARLAWSLRTIYVLSRTAEEGTLSADNANYWAQCAEAFGVAGASVRTSPKIYGPITVGIKRKLVLLPPDMLATLPDTELRTAIAHEFAHMRRHDFAKNLLYELLCLPVRFSPGPLSYTLALDGNARDGL